MKVRNLLKKIVNGEDLPQKIKINNGIYVLNNLHNLDEIYAIENTRWEYYNFSLIDCYDNEVELIEEDKKIEKYDTGLTNGRYTEDSIKTGLDTDITIENIIINMGIEITLVKEKMFEIIDKINSMENK